MPKEKLQEAEQAETEEVEAQPDNMRIWNQVCISNKQYIKKVQYGGRQYDTIAAYSQFKQATELWGPQGIGWDVTDPAYEINSKGGGVLLICTLSLWYVDRGQKYTLSADTSAIQLENKSGYFDSDAWKKIKTECTTKALSRMGFNADVFTGQLDIDSKYHNEESQKTSWDKSKEGKIDTMDDVRDDYKDLAIKYGFENDREGVITRAFKKRYAKKTMDEVTVREMRFVLQDIVADFTPPEETK